jgi:ABC-type transporter Mla subunit MlaD
MSSNGTGPHVDAATGGSAAPEQLEADIARQREELAATVIQLQQKLDVKARARDEVHHLKDRATTASGRLRPDLTVAAVAAVALLAGLVVWRRRR